jgi:rod shape-determining protein MreD
MKRQWLLTFLSLLLLWVIVTQFNHYLAVWHLHLFAGALYVTFSALRLPARGGLVISALAGLLCDANTAVPFGTHLLLFSVAHALMSKAHHRIPSEHPTTQLVIALITNLGLYTALAVVMTINTPLLGGMWPRMLFDLLLSQLFIVLVGPWFFALQSRILLLDRLALRGRF